MNPVICGLRPRQPDGTQQVQIPSRAQGNLTVSPAIRSSDYRIPLASAAQSPLINADDFSWVGKDTPTRRINGQGRHFAPLSSLPSARTGYWVKTDRSRSSTGWPWQPARRPAAPGRPSPLSWRGDESRVPLAMCIRMGTPI